MSVAATISFARPKRTFEEAEGHRDSPTSCVSKRVRFHPHSPAVGNIQRLCQLFPDMEESTVISVLCNCGDNIDAAIERLGQLRLSAEEAGHDSTSEAASRRDQDELPSTSGTRTPAEWVEMLVQEMAAASNVEDARQRAARVLSMFSKSITGTDQAHSELLSKVQELLKENHILKRAVQIQNTKIQERSHLDQEAQQLRLMLGQCQEQVRALEMNNYSLALHLQQATNDPSASHGHRPPDVF